MLCDAGVSNKLTDNCEYILNMEVSLISQNDLASLTKLHSNVIFGDNFTLVVYYPNELLRLV